MKRRDLLVFLGGSAFWPLAGILQGFPNGSSGCIGFQVDGAGFTEHFVVGY